MKLAIAVLTAIMMLFLSCKKEETKKPDLIFYTDFNPDLVVSSIDSIIQIPYSPCSCIPSPSSGTDFEELDIDGDGENEFKIVYHHWYGFLSASSPCVNYLRDVTIESLKENCGIASTPDDTRNVKPFADGDVISQDENYVEIGHIYENRGFWGYAGFGAQAMIGVKLANRSVGWIQIKHQYCSHRIVIMDCAINKTSTNSIVAGQKT